MGIGLEMLILKALLGAPEPLSPPRLHSSHSLIQHGHLMSVPATCVSFSAAGEVH